VRLSIGLEDPRDIVDDLRRALDGVSAAVGETDADRQLAETGSR